MVAWNGIKIRWSITVFPLTKETWFEIWGKFFNTALDLVLYTFYTKYSTSKILHKDSEVNIKKCKDRYQDVHRQEILNICIDRYMYDKKGHRKIKISRGRKILLFTSLDEKKKFLTLLSICFVYFVV